MMATPTKKHIIERVRDAGIIGKGGAGFPTHAKFLAVKGGAEYVLANGVECEPLLSNDKVLMERFPYEIVEGLRLAMKAVSARAGVICLKDKYKKAAAALKKEIKESDNITIATLGNFYPAGDEVIMVKEVLGRTVPAGGLPLDVGVVVNNIGTLKKICKAVDLNENITRKYVSLNGEVNEPKLVNVPIGMRISEVLDLAGGVKIDDYRIISGGPNMGKIVSRDDVVKTTTGALIVLPKEHPLVTQQSLNVHEITNRAKAACINCRLCTDMCPRYLIGHGIEPHRIMRAINLNLDSQTEALTGALFCSGCGVCETYACFMMLSPRKICQQVKRELLKRGVRRGKAGSDNTRSSDENLSERKIPAERLKARLKLSEYSDSLQLDNNIHTAKEVKITLDQHIGALSVPVVAINDKVKAGDRIADIAEGKLGATYHASIDGTVSKVTKEYIEIRGETR